MKPMFEMLAGYNEWANRRLYDAAAGLSDADYRADHGAFFGSVHGTLNHLLVGDRVWMHRFTGEGPSPTRLDEILYDDFAGLRAAREAEDARIAAYVASLAPSDFDGTIRYRTISNPADIEQELKLALLHVFNHQTHHRGQVHCLLTRITDAAPSLDLILYQREAGVGLVGGAPLASTGPVRRAVQ
ncbi:MAG TPA: DinB family protein [Methyloceanibacter sp.]|nr:DinB family protein [Methyloceanibacter sp.]